MNGAAQSIDPAACKSRLLLAQRHADALTQLLVCLNEDFSAVSAAGQHCDDHLRKNRDPMPVLNVLFNPVLMRRAVFRI
eukprot:2263463-Amphidinium_carterae.1